MNLQMLEKEGAYILVTVYGELERGRRERFTVKMVVIVQGLRESGVFSSIISSAQESLSRDKFLASFESSNSSKAAASESLPSRKIGRNQHSQAARRVLEESVTHFEFHEEAIPPRPPPGMDADVITEA
ncbi:hypothetical protein FXO37_09001 [Capsicum annuum]|nr:hypothetical protein FXO37_09001 [Capsicum annuum]